MNPMGKGDTVTAMKWSVLAFGVVAPITAGTLTMFAGLGALGVWMGLAVGLAVAAAGLVPAALRA